MNTMVHRVILLAFGLLMATSIQADELVIPDRAGLQVMSQEEYASYRRRIQSSVDALGGTERNLARDPASAGSRDAGYGQGYALRHARGGGGRFR